MGRYTTVQTYADNNPKLSAVPYETATGRKFASSGDVNLDKKQDKVKPERVHNQYSSNAGASSSVFDEYRATRRKEMHRLRKMDKEYAETEEAQLERQRRLEREEQEKERTRKRAEKRRRRKMKKRAGREVEKMKKAKGLDGKEEDEADEGDEEENLECAVDMTEAEKELQKVDPTTSIEFPNDGSFLERMKKQLNGGSSSSSHEANETENTESREENKQTEDMNGTCEEEEGSSSSKSEDAEDCGEARATKRARKSE